MENFFEVSVQEFIDYAKINNINVAELSTKESEHIMNILQLNKRKAWIKDFVKKRHVNKDGLPRAITPPNNKGGYWSTRDPRSKTNKIRAKDLDSLYEKLYEIYSQNENNSYTIGAWYDIGIELRINRTNPQPSTIERHDRTKKSYFTEEFLACDVRDITSSFLWAYMREAQQKHDMSLSEVKQLKGTLNIIFQAASDPEVGCRENNPLININPSSLFKNNVRAFKNIKPKTNMAFSEAQVKTLRENFQKRIDENRHSYERCKYSLMGLLSSYTGMRASELPAIRWDDIKEDHIYLHQMQIRHDGKRGDDRFEIVPWLKEEKGRPQGGRKIPFIDPNIPKLLSEIKSIQEELNIESEYVFPETDSVSYERSLYKLCKKLGYNVTNNHAFRKSFNMWMVSIGLNVAERAAILGHSTTINLERYTVTTDSFVEDAIEKSKLAVS